MDTNPRNSLRACSELCGVRPTSTGKSLTFPGKALAGRQLFSQLSSPVTLSHRLGVGCRKDTVLSNTDLLEDPPPPKAGVMDSEIHSVIHSFFLSWSFFCFFFFSLTVAKAITTMNLSVSFCWSKSSPSPTTFRTNPKSLSWPSCHSCFLPSIYCVFYASEQDQFLMTGRDL